MCSKVWSRRISSWDRDVSKLLSEICMHGWKRIKKKWTRLLSKWLILIFIQIRITIRIEKRAQREEKSGATFKLISRISKKFIRRVNSIDTNISNSIKLFQRTTQSSNYRISITDYVVLDERDTHSTFYGSVSSAKRKIWKNATNPVIIPFFFCLVFHSCMKKKRKKKKKYSQLFLCVHFLVQYFSSCREHWQTYVHAMKINYQNLLREKSIFSSIDFFLPCSKRKKKTVHCNV